MTFRAKLKKTFSKKSSGSGESTPSGDNNYAVRTDIEYYKPNEIPKSKYRGKVDKAHKEKLESFTFADAFATVRRKSSQALSGTFSPGGTKSQSRRASWISRPKSRGSATGSEQDNRSVRRKSVAAAGIPSAEPVTENEDEDAEVVNADLTNTITHTDVDSNDTTLTNGAISIPTVRLERLATEVNGSPFTTDELDKAMSRISLKQRHDSAVAEPEATPA